jgi:hypothetical protein
MHTPPEPRSLRDQFFAHDSRIIPEKKRATVTFKAKPWNLHHSDGSLHRCVTVKKKIVRHDCNLNPHEHTYYNSTLFIPLLQRAFLKATDTVTYKGGRDYIDLDNLPPHITADTSGYLAVITVTLPEDFS